MSLSRALAFLWLSTAVTIAQAPGSGAQGGDGKASSPGGGGGGGGGGSGATSPALKAEQNFQNRLLGEFAMDLLIALTALVGALFVYRIVQSSMHHIRMLTCLRNDTQRYFTVPNETWAKIKKNIIYAPMFRVRHNREFRLSSAVNMGTLPTRFQTFLQIAILTMNVLFCVYQIPFGEKEPSVLKFLRNRTGTIAVANLLPLIIMADRNNPLIKLLNISFDSFNFFHRFFGRLVVLESIAHVVCYTISAVQTGGWSRISEGITKDTMLKTGFIAIIAFVVILVQSPSPLRHAFYEIFHHLHIALAALAFAAVYIHLDGLPQQMMLFGAILVWAGSWFSSALNLLYRNVGNGGTKAMIEALPGDALRVTFKPARPWTFRPGQHMYITIPSVGLWMSHPFSVAWSNVTTPLYPPDSSEGEKGIPPEQTTPDVLAKRPTTVSAIIRRRTGFTDALWKKAEKSNAWNGVQLTVRAFVAGPYGVSHPMTSYGTVVLFAGGVGITHSVPYIRSLVAGYGNGSVAARRVLLVWTIQSPEHLEWIRPWMTEVLGMEGRRDVLRIQLFITRPRSAKEVHSPSSTVQMFPGRPNVETIIQQECENMVGAMAVNTCGTGELQDEVRRCVRARQTTWNIDLVEESFTR